MTRVAAVDLGTNSTRLLVADVEDGRLREVVRRLAITRLGERVDEGGRLLPAAVGRVRDVLAGFRRELDELGAERTLVVATSAVRDAENGEAFLGEIERSYGLATRLLDGREEAELTFRGVTSDRSVEPGTLVLDVGGGSTELVLGGPEGVERAWSLQVGSVRLTERHLPSDPPTAAELEACARDARAALPALEPRRMIGVAGTVTTLAALDLGLAAWDPERTHGHVVTREAVGRQLARLAALPLSERRAVPGLEPERAPVIVAGIVIVLETLRAYGLLALEASERDLLDGAALAAAELSGRDEGPAYTCC